MSSFTPVTFDDIKKLVASMATKSCNLDPMPTSLVKAAINPLGPVMVEIINRSLMSGVFPSCYKEARVFPLLKKPSLDPESLKNYRPVSNLAFLSKVLEKAVVSQLNTYLKENSLLEPAQSAYRQGHSTETALVRVQNDIIHAVGQRKVVLLVLWTYPLPLTRSVTRSSSRPLATSALVVPCSSGFPLICQIGSSGSNWKEQHLNQSSWTVRVPQDQS